MAILVDDRPQVEVEVHEAKTTTAVVDREELLAQEFGLTKETAKRVWKVLKADVRREIEAALRVKYSLHLVAWIILSTAFSAATSANNPWVMLSVLLVTITPWVGLRAYCQEMTNYDVPWERKATYVYSVWMALAHPKPGDEITLHTPLIQAVMLFAHEPARKELTRRGLRVAINNAGRLLWRNRPRRDDQGPSHSVRRQTNGRRPHDLLLTTD